MTRQLCSATMVLATLVSVFPIATEAEADSWIFKPGKYSHHPATGERLNQFAPLPEIAALPDPRPFTSGYTRQRILQRGANGTQSDYTRVENWGNDRGGIDAQWERVNNVWQRSVLSGGYGYGGNVNYQDPRYGRYPGYDNRYPDRGYGGPGNGGPGYGGPGYGGPGYGGPGYGGPGYGNPGYGAPGYRGPGYGLPGPAYANPLPFDGEDYDPWRYELRRQRPWNEPPVRRDHYPRDKGHHPH